MIEVVSPGFYTSVQDMGRFGYADKGVPCSGVMDGYSAQLANHIIGNSKNDAVLEITLGKCILKFEKQTIICISGSDLSAKLNDVPVEMNKTIQVEKNDVLSFGKTVFGVRSYLAVRGGIQTSKVLKSRSFYRNITEQFRIQKNESLPIVNLQKGKSVKYASVKFDKDHFTDNNLIAYPGPEFNLLNFDQKNQLKSLRFTISKDNSRMGYRLNELIYNELPSLLTSAVMPGTVQLTPSGKLIVLMRDCQVTGGYPRVLQLSEKAINRLAQKSTGDRFRFNIEPLMP